MQSVGLFNVQEDTIYLLYLPTGELITRPLRTLNNIRHVAYMYLKVHTEIEEIKVFSVMENGPPEFETTIARKGKKFQEKIKVMGVGMGSK